MADANVKVVKDKFKKRAGGFKNKVGRRDNGRPIRSVPTNELKELLVKIKTGGKGVWKRDRNKVELELNRRGFDVSTIV